MDAIKNMERRTLGSLGVVVAIILFVALNILSVNMLKSARLDLTENGLFTLSEGTRKVLAGIDEPLTLRFYASRGLMDQSPAHANYISRVREFLEHAASISGGMLKIEMLDPEPFSAIEDEAVSFGLQGVPLNDAGELGYFGLAATNSTDDQEVIPFFNLAREANLEYDLTRLFHNLARPKQKVVGLLASLPIESDPTRNRKPWAIVDSMRQFFEVRTIDPDVKVIEDSVDVLMIAHPKGLSDQTLYAIDQFILRGGNALVMVDPHSESMVAMFAAMRRTVPSAGSNLKKLFDSWGIEFKEDTLIGDLGNAVKVQARSEGRSITVDYLTWMELGPDSLARDDVLTGELRRIFLAASGAITPKKDATTKFTPIMTSSRRTQKIPVSSVIRLPDPLGLLKKFKSENKIYTFAARVSGKVKSAFPDGPPRPKKKDKADKEPAPQGDAAKKLAANHLKESKAPTNLVVLADSDLMADRFWVQTQNFFGRQVTVATANNGDFIINALDNLTGSDALISLRSRGLSARPFHRVIKLQKDAELRYRKTEQGLQEKMQEIEKKLGDLQDRKRSNANVVMTGEQKATIEKFRTDLVNIRRQLREVQRALKVDIETLDTWLKTINIWAMPLLVSIIAVVMAILRRVRRRRLAPVN